MTKPTIPDVIEKFYQYYLKNPVWGSLHIVLDDGNIKDEHVRHCLDKALERNDLEGAQLAETLLTMSKTQRLKIPMVIYGMMDKRGDKFA